MLTMSSINPNRNRKELPANTTSDSVVFGTAAAYINTVARKIAVPPSIADGRFCTRPNLGFATNPYREAIPRTSQVRSTASTKLAAPANIGEEMNDCIETRLDEASVGGSCSDASTEHRAIQVLYVRDEPFFAVNGPREALA